MLRAETKRGPSRFHVPTRYVIILLGIFANAVQYTIRVNLSVTIVAMVNGSAAIESTSSSFSGSSPAVNPFNVTTNESHFDPSAYCADDDIFETNASQTAPIDKQGTFDWSQNIQGVILGAFYYGYIITNISAGQVAEYLGPRWMVAISLFTSSVLTILTPLAASWHYAAVVAIRVATGLAQGLLSPAVYSLFARWIPKQERRIALALILVGGNIGTILTMPLSGFLCNSAIGWPSVFYTLGAFGFFWTLVWIYCVHNTPDSHPRISEEEMLYIHSNLDLGGMATKSKRQALKTPWVAMLTSPATWAVASSRFAGQFGNLMLMSKLPAYLEGVLHVPIEKNGMINAIVYATFSVALTGCGYVADVVNRRQCFSKTTNCKIFQSIALGGPALCLILIPSMGCSQELVIALIIIGMTIFGFQAGGDNPIVVDMAPDFSGSLYGFTNSFGSLPGFLAPQIVGVLLGNTHGNRHMWARVFYLTSAIYGAGILIFVLFGSADVQPWGRAPRPPRSRHTSRQESNLKMGSRPASRRNSTRRSPRPGHKMLLTSLDVNSNTVDATNTMSATFHKLPDLLVINMNDATLNSTLNNNGYSSASVSRNNSERRRAPRSRSVSRTESIRIVDVMGLNSVEEHLAPEQETSSSEEEIESNSDLGSIHTLHEVESDEERAQWTHTTIDTVVRQADLQPVATEGQIAPRTPLRASSSNGHGSNYGTISTPTISVQWLSPAYSPFGHVVTQPATHVEACESQRTHNDMIDEAETEISASGSERGAAAENESHTRF